jgi:hypothetical protein
MLCVNYFAPLQSDAGSNLHPLATGGDRLISNIDDANAVRRIQFEEAHQRSYRLPYLKWQLLILSTRRCTLLGYLSSTNQL